jgi:hypothetical protein
MAKRLATHREEAALAIWKIRLRNTFEMQKRNIAVASPATKTEEPYDAIADLREFIKDLERFPNDDTFRFETDREGAKAILAAIRNAENDAYETAAKRVEEFLSGSAISVPIAAVIRFLKEPN